MNKLTKALAASAIIAGAVFAAPVAANAATYVPPTTPVVSSSTGASTVAPGGSFTVNFGAGTFTPNGAVSVTLTSTGTVPTDATIKPATFVAAQSAPITGTAGATGAAVLTGTVPANATASITVSATDLATGHVVTATIAVAAAAGTGTGTASSSLATTGTYISIATIWGAVGLVALGGGLIAVRVVTRRKGVVGEAA